MNAAPGPKSGRDGASRTQTSPATAGRGDATSIGTKRAVRSRALPSSPRDPTLRSRPPARVDRAARVRGCSTAYGLLPAAAIRAPRLAGQRISVTVFDERVNAREQPGALRGRDRAPQREREEADAAAQTAAHASGHDAGLNDR